MKITRQVNITNGDDLLSLREYGGSVKIRIKHAYSDNAVEIGRDEIKELIFFLNQSLNTPTKTEPKIAEPAELAFGETYFDERAS